VLNGPSAAGAAILVAGANFGCGSSREHAPWALAGFGFRAVVARSFADIFRNNALKNGLLPVAVDAAAHAEILARLRQEPAAELTVDLATQTLTLPGGREVSFPVEAFAKSCLLNGVDELGYILRFEGEIAAFERRSGRVPA
jgi:3-isopropylmalate/(R)-2-methylmalate dehydratase small subunit